MANREDKHWMIGCDWGTSSFRIRLVDTIDGAVVAEIRSGEGVASTFNQWNDLSQPEIPRFQFFEKKLESMISKLAAKAAADLSKLPIIVTGMASSSIGMEELPYAELPLDLTADNLLVRHYDPSSRFNHPMVLVSGIRSQRDVMRGEEVQLLGLLSLVPNPTASERIFILPGTHSKHCVVKDNRLVGFQTYLTGELYNLLITHSLLKASVDVSPADTWTNADGRAFAEGVELSRTSGLLASLFSVRTNSLFDVMSKTANSYYLSGLLIGSELAYLNQQGDERPIVVCGGSQVHTHYLKAMDVLNLTARVQLLPGDYLDQATINGQLGILKQYFPVDQMPCKA